MPIPSKLQPLAEQLLAVLLQERQDAQAGRSDPTAIIPAKWTGREAGAMSTKAIMAAANVADLGAARAGLKALVAEGLVYRLGRTRSTSYKAVLDSDGADDSDGGEGSCLLASGSDGPPAVIVLGGDDLDHLPINKGSVTT